MIKTLSASFQAVWIGTIEANKYADIFTRAAIRRILTLTSCRVRRQM
jgi:hypothetical protein